jgi:hypothetical protein
MCFRNFCSRIRKYFEDAASDPPPYSPPVTKSGLLHLDDRDWNEHIGCIYQKHAFTVYAGVTLSFLILQDFDQSAFAWLKHELIHGFYLLHHKQNDILSRVSIQLGGSTAADEKGACVFLDKCSQTVQSTCPNYSPNGKHFLTQAKAFMTRKDWDNILVGVQALLLYVEG